MIRLVPVLLLFTLSATTGCVGFYRTKMDTSDYVLYSDQKHEQLQSTGDYLGRVMDSFRNLFGREGRDVPRPVVVYDEDDLVRQDIYTTEIKQEGYYLPVLRLIHLSPQLPPRESRQGRTVILHEMTHHFLISTFPRSSDLYWLNEGIACSLENSFFDDDGELQRPMYHGWLHREARRALDQLGDEALMENMRRLLDCSWFEFHGTGDKTRHYALSWAFTTLLLERTPGDLESQVRWILKQTPETLEPHVRRLPAWLRRDPQDLLESLAADPALRGWAVQRWLELDIIDGGRLLGHVLPGIDDPDPRERARAYGDLTRVVTRSLYNLDETEAHSLRVLLTRRLKPEYSREATSICRALQRSGRHPQFIPPLVDLLASPDPDLRADAARALARLSVKPTITRPEFWSHASESERAAEIAEWHVWLRNLRQ